MVGWREAPEEHLVSIARSSDWFMPCVVAVRQLELPSLCIGAGAVRDLVWDSLHGCSTRSRLSEVDVAYFAPDNVGAERDEGLQRRLDSILPGVPWEVTNQAGVHLWFEDSFGHPVEPLSSLVEAVASWPEYATAVGLTLEVDDAIRIIAPYGLDDLFSMTVRRNPVRVSQETYSRRIRDKQYLARWPKATVIG